MNIEHFDHFFTSLVYIVGRCTELHKIPRVGNRHSSFKIFTWWKQQQTTTTNSIPFPESLIDFFFLFQKNFYLFHSFWRIMSSALFVLFCFFPSRFFSFYSVFRLILFVFVCFFICVRACAACCPITVDPPPDTQPCKFLPAKKKQKKQTNKTFMYCSRERGIWY
jgi:hypothetical protein